MCSSFARLLFVIYVCEGVLCRFANSMPVEASSNNLTETTTAGPEPTTSETILLPATTQSVVEFNVSTEREVYNVTSRPENIVAIGNVTELPEGGKVDKDVIQDPKTSKKNLNSTNSNYIIEYKPQVFDSPEDIKTQQEWGGNCTVAHWDKCKALETWFGNYEDPKDGEIKNYIIDCKLEPVVCLRNSWTVTRCNLLCMSRCNREIQFKYDKYVSHSGECKAHAHG